MNSFTAFNKFAYLASIVVTLSGCTPSPTIELNLKNEYSQNLRIEKFLSGNDSIHIRVDLQVDLKKTGDKEFTYEYYLDDFYSYTKFRGEEHIVYSKFSHPFRIFEPLEQGIHLTVDNNNETTKDYHFPDGSSVPKTAAALELDFIKIVFPKDAIVLNTPWSFQVHNQFKGGTKYFTYRVRKIEETTVTLDFESQITGPFRQVSQNGKGTCVLHKDDFSIKTMEMEAQMSSGTFRLTVEEEG